MKTLTLDLPEHLAEDLAGVDPEFIIKVIEAGLQQVHQVSEFVSEHPYVTRVPGKRGERPIIRGTGITVSLIAGLYKAGDTVDEILESYPHLRPSWVHDAIGYYLDHQDEIEREIRENRMECLAEQHDLTIDERGFVHFSEQAGPDEQ
ncbi:MAG: DUF433 domain-containing protein [Anaerolineae bacterium]